MKKLLFLLVFLGTSFSAFSQGFKTKWNTTRRGIPTEKTIRIQTNENLQYNYDVDIDEDGIMDFTNVTDDLFIFFDEPGEHIIEIFGTFPQLGYATNHVKPKELLKLIDVMEWGDVSWQNLDRMFYGCDSLVISALDTPDLALINSLNYTFADIEFLEVNINHWDVSSVSTFEGTFFKSNSLSANLKDWDVSNGISFKQMFRNAESFNGNISDWNLESAESLEGMFQNTKAFSSDISNWDLSNVTNLENMFNNSEGFNSDISAWNVSNVANMARMFADASTFNQDLSSWDVASAESMGSMFRGAINFNHDLSSWDFPSITDGVEELSFFVANSGLSVELYDKLLIKMKDVGIERVIGFGNGLEYCNAENERAYLIDELTWLLLNDEKNCVVNVNEVAKNYNLYSSYNGIHLFMDSSSDQDIHLSLIDLQGRSVANYIHPSGERQSVFDSSNIPTGMYFIRALGITSKVYIH